MSKSHFPIALFALLFLIAAAPLWPQASTGTVPGTSWAALAAQAPVRERSIVIDTAEAEYTIDAGGTIDPENVEIAVENLGETPVINPRITVNGLYDWYDTASIVREVTRDAKNDEEKAMALWWWVLYKRFQRSPHDMSALHPVRAMNGYGYGICGHTSAWLKCLWQAAGLKARVWEITGHTISEVFWDGAWHMLDGNVKVFYLDRDNKTVAPLATLEKDKWLIERGIHPRDPWFRGPDSPSRNREFVNYIISSRDNWESNGYDREFNQPYTMAMTLKPGETLVRWWKPELGKFEGRDQQPDAPERYANGRLIWAPDLARIDMKPYIRVREGTGNTATRAQDGRSPAIHVAQLQDRLYTRESNFTIPIASPYPILGGRLWCTLVKEGDSGRDRASISFSPGNTRLYYFQWDRGARDLEIDLDPSLLRTGPLYRYDIGFTMSGNAEANPPTQAGLDRFRVVTDLQVSPHSLPALALGRNLVRYRDESGVARKVRITHRWKETGDRRPPAKVKSGQEALPLLRWVAAEGAADYQVMVSLRPDCRWPLSPALWQNVGSSKTEWRVPDSFLNRGTTYYWKVRGRSSQGDIGEWSEVFEFRTP